MPRDEKMERIQYAVEKVISEAFDVAKSAAIAGVKAVFVAHSVATAVDDVDIEARVKAGFDKARKAFGRVLGEFMPPEDGDKKK